MCIRDRGKVNLALLNVLVVNEYGVFIVCALTGNLVCLCAAVSKLSLIHIFYSRGAGLKN